MKDKYQNPIGMYVPGLETHPVWDTSRFDWAIRFEEAAPIIKQELKDLLSSQTGFSIIYPKGGASKLQTDTGAWGISWFHIYGARNEELISQCPVTAQLLDSVPTVNFAGLSLFSTMMPGTHLPAHCGTTNAKLRINLPLIAEDSKIRVADRIYTLEENKLFIFDDSFEHEVFENSTSPRFSLLFDIYHPSLKPDEIAIISSKINTAFQETYKKMFSYNASYDTSWIYK